MSLLERLFQTVLLLVGIRALEVAILLYKIGIETLLSRSLHGLRFRSKQLEFAQA
jgi:hypothetical protein